WTEIVVRLQWCRRNRVGGRHGPTGADDAEAERADDHGCGHEFRQPHRQLTPTSKFRRRMRRRNVTIHSQPGETQTSAPVPISAVAATPLPIGCCWWIRILRKLEGAQATDAI